MWKRDYQWKLNCVRAERIKPFAPPCSRCPRIKWRPTTRARLSPPGTTAVSPPSRWTRISRDVRGTTRWTRWTAGPPSDGRRCRGRRAGSTTRTATTDAVPSAWRPRRRRNAAATVAAAAAVTATTGSWWSRGWNGRSPRARRVARRPTGRWRRSCRRSTFAACRATATLLRCSAPSSLAWSVPRVDPRRVRTYLYVYIYIYIRGLGATNSFEYSFE